MAVNRNIFGKISDLFLKYFAVKEFLFAGEAVLVLLQSNWARFMEVSFCLTSLLNITIQSFLKRGNKVNTPIWCNWCNIMTPACPGLVCYFLGGFMRRVLKSRNWARCLIQTQDRGLGLEIRLGLRGKGSVLALGLPQDKPCLFSTTIYVCECVFVYTLSSSDTDSHCWC